MSQRAFPSEMAISAVSNRRTFIGGSDARVIMSNNEDALLRLWRQKRGEAEPPDYSDNLIVQLGVATEALNRRWFEKTAHFDACRVSITAPINSCQFQTRTDN